MSQIMNFSIPVSLCIQWPISTDHELRVEGGGVWDGKGQETVAVEISPFKTFY